MLTGIYAHVKPGNMGMFLDHICERKLGMNTVFEAHFGHYRGAESGCGAEFRVRA